MPSSESTLNEESPNTTPAHKVASSVSSNTSTIVTNTQDTDAQASLLRITRRHSLPASYHLSSFLSFFSSHNSTTNNSSNVNQVQESTRAQPQTNSNNTRHTRSATTSGLAGQTTTTTSSSVNRHRYGHRHTRSAVLDQPVVVRTYNPPATPRLPTRAGMMNPAIFEEEEIQRVELPPIEAFSFDGILRAINPEVSKTLDRISYLCLRLREDVKAEIEVMAQTQKEIHGQKQQAERLAAQALKTTNSRSDTLTADSNGLRGGAAIEDLAQLTERTYTTLGSIVSTLLAIDELLPPQERLAPDYSAHQSHYPKVHGLLNKKYQEISARFGGSAVALGRGAPGARTIPKITKQTTFTSPAFSPPGSPPDPLSASLPNPTHQEPGWLRRRMSSNSAMLLSQNSPNANDIAAKRISLPPHLQLKIILPAPSYGQSPPHDRSPALRRGSPSGLNQHTSNIISRRQSTNTLLLSRERSERRYHPRPASELGDGGSSTRRSTSSSFSGGIFGSSSWKGTGKWGFFGSGAAGSNESERGLSAEENLRRVLNGSNGKGKGIDRR